MKRFRSKSCSSRLTSRLLALSTALFVSWGLAQPAAEAYYYPFYYRGLSNLLYPLRYAAYPLLGLTGPVSAWTTATPYRLATGRLVGYPYMYGPQMLKNYNDEEPLYSPRKRVKQQRLGQGFGVDEVNHAQWADGSLAPQTVADAQYMQGATPGSLQIAGMPQSTTYPPGATFAMPPGVTPMPSGFPAGTSNFAVGAPQPAADGTPPTAPQVVQKKPINLAPNTRDIANQTGSAVTHSPLADGFVSHINSRFNGNIEAALFDPDTRKYARVLGLVSDDSLFGIDFTNTRVELVRQILADESLNSVSKLDTIKILLNSGANRAKH